MKQAINPQHTRDRIVTAAIKLFAERGFDGITTREIAKAVGIASPSLYKHFASMDDIIFEALQRVTEQRGVEYRIVLAQHLAPQHMLKEVARVMIAGFLQDTTLVHLYQHVLHPRASKVLDLSSSIWDADLYPQFLDLIHKVDASVDPAFTYYLLFSFCLGAATYMPTQDRRRPLSDAERDPLLLAERGLAAALPRIDWTKVAPINPAADSSGMRQSHPQT